MKIVIQLARTCVLIVAVVVGSGGCGGSAADSPRVTPSATAVKPSVPGPLPNIFSAGKARRVQGAAAAQRYGQPAIDAAYREMVNVTFASRYNARVMALKPSDTKPSDFSFLLPYMTSHAQQEWRTYVAARLSDKNAAAAVAAMRHYGWNGGGYQMRSGLPDVISAPTFSSATATMDDTAGPRLRLRFRSGVTVRLTDPKSNHVLYTTIDDLTLLLTRNRSGDRADVPWLIDGWHVGHKRGTFRPDPMG
jgi:hypothetical protein